MEHESKKLSKGQICSAVSLALIVALLTSLVIVLWQPPTIEVEAKEPVSIDVSIEGETKLSANTPYTFTARVFASEVGDLSYEWSISPENSNVVLAPDSAVCVVTFVVATEDPYTLEVQVHDDAGNFGVASKAIYDPPTYPDYYLGVSTAPYSYMIKADGTGWYYAVDGSTGAVSWSSTNASYIFQNVFDAAPARSDSEQSAGGFTVNVMNPSTFYDMGSTTLTFPDSPITLIGEGQYSTYLKWTSLTDGNHAMKFSASDYTDRDPYVTIKNMAFRIPDGLSNSNVFNFSYLPKLVMENVYMAGDGCLRGISYSPQDNEFVVLTNVIADGFNSTAVTESGGFYFNADHVLLENCGGWNCKKGLIWLNEGFDNTVIGFHAYHCSTQSFKVDDGNNRLHIKFIDCLSETDTSGNPSAYDFYGSAINEKSSVIVENLYTANYRLAVRDPVIYNVGGSISYNEIAGYVIKSVPISTGGGWSEDYVLQTGDSLLNPFAARVNTGVNASSRVSLYSALYGFSGSFRDRMDYTKKLTFEFSIARLNSDAEAVSYVQIKQSAAHGNLSDVGFGILINNYAVYGESYGTTRSTVSLGTITDDNTWNIRVVFSPGSRLDFFVNDELVGSLTGSAIPVGVSATSYMVMSIANGVSGGVDARLYVSGLTLIQEGI